MNIDDDFDCLKMKDEIQARLRREWEGLSEQEIREQIRRNLEASQTPIARWWRRVRDQQAARR